MLKTEYVAAFIEEQLNIIGVAEPKPYEFKLYAEIGENEAIGKIKGIVKRINGEQSAITDYTDVDYVYSCTLSVPCVRTNSKLLSINAIVDKLAKKFNGKSIELCDGKALITFKYNTQVTKKEEFSNIPLSFNIEIKFVEDAITSNDKHWFLDDLEIPFKTEGVIIDREGVSHKINGEEFSKTLITGQVKTYQFTFPYDANSELCVKLQRDILNGNLDKTYKLKYYDGAAYTKDNPFITTVTIFKNGDTRVQRLGVSDFNISFTDVDDGSSETKYYLGLCDTVFDNSSENTRFFAGANGKTAKQVQTEYWERKVEKGCVYEQIKAPNLDSIDITNQIYKNTKNYELFDLVNKNFAVIKVIDGNGNINYFYYFVTNATIGAKNQVSFDLKLDTVQTYFFDNGIVFSDCLIHRAHLDRWIHGSGSKVQFEYREQLCNLFEREDITNVSKRLKKRTKVSLNNFFKDDAVNKWLDDHVLCWIYAFIDPTHEYTVAKPQNADGIKESFSNFHGTRIVPYGVDPLTENTSSAIDSQVRVIAVPVYKDKGSIFIESNSGNSSALKNVRLSVYGLKFFMKNNEDASYFYSMKISPIPPFGSSFIGIPDDLTAIVQGDDLILRDNIQLLAASESIDIPWLDFEYKLSTNIPFANGTAYYCTKGTSSTSQVDGIFSINFQHPSIKTKPLEIESKFEFKKSEMVGVKKNPLFNPKLLSSDYKSLRVCDHTGDGFDYDIQKLALKDVEILYTEPLTADITRTYIRISNPISDSVFIDDTSQNYTGFCGTNDLSLILRTEAFKTMLANNKNFYNQTWLNAGMNGIMAGLNGATNAKSTAGLGLSLAGSFLSTAQELINSAMTEDNMRNAPASIQNAKGNAFFNLMVSSLGVYIEEYDILENEKKIINDYMDLYGFSYNRVDKLYNVCNIRKYHNYVKAELNSIGGAISMSNNARSDLRQRFQNGVRFWNTDYIQYELENYENWFEENN